MNNDLISREALRKAFHERIYHFDKSSWDEANAIIDNAPTVDVSGNEYFPYRTAYFNGVADGRATARPQGEWENDSDNLPICNKCGEIALQRIFVKMPHLIQDVRMVRSNYCPNCGAAMREVAADDI